MPLPWNPRSVLNIYPERHDFTCAGTTKKGARCRQSMISGADLSKASQMLDTMSLSRPASRTIRNKLSDLAYLTLCPRWHRKPGYCQVTEMTEKWQRAIENYCDSATGTIHTTASRRRPAASTRSSPSRAINSPEPVRARRAISSSTASSTAQSTESEAEDSTASSSESEVEDSTASSSESEAEDSTASSTESEVEDSAASSSESESEDSRPVPQRSTIRPPRPNVSSTPPASPGRSPAPAVATPPRTSTSSRSLDLLTPPTTPSRRYRSLARAVSPTNTGSRRTSRPSSATVPLTPSKSTSSVPVHTPCSYPHRVTRKPITEDCGICYESICCPDDAVWCRAQCGQNIHRECFRTWREQSLREAEGRRMDYDGEEGDRSGAVHCVFCRVRWRWEWED